MASERPVPERHNRSKFERFWPAIVVGVGLIALALFAVLRPAPDRASRTDTLSFSLPMLSGGGTLSSKDLRGRPVVLNFWASWCDPCRREMPALQRVHEHYEGRVHIVGVDVQDAPANAKEFANEIGVKYPLVVADSDDPLVRELNVASGLPRTFFIDERGRLTGDEVLGEITEQQLIDTLDGLLEPS
jgi:cytochrome c biogenesis protein CcmG, thiol:disulfide interchange protein DsbE